MTSCFLNFKEKHFGPSQSQKRQIRQTVTDTMGIIKQIRHFQGKKLLNLLLT